MAKSFYQEFLPEVEHIMGGKAAAEPILNEFVYKDPMHRWYKEGMSKEELKRLEEFYRKRYGGKEAK